MPLFMDRHDLPDATAEDVARAHVSDVEASTRHGVELLTYWFDPDRGRAFCLARAPAHDNLVALHREAHGMIPNEIIGVSEDNVLRFLGTIQDPGDRVQRTSAFRAILFTDLEGSTALLEELGQAEFMVLLTEHDLIIRRALVAAQGHEVKHTGDGIMASFDDVGRGLECAIAIQDGFDVRARTVAGPALRVRIGIAAGEPVDRNGDLFGSSVNLASRICGVAEAGRILCSDVVRDLGHERGFVLREVGAEVLKGFAEPTRVFELERAPAA